MPRRTITTQLPQLFFNIAHQTAPVVSTWSACSNSECTGKARSGRECLDCLTKDLTSIVGEDLATQFVTCCKRHAELVSLIQDKVDELEGEQ